ncbi:MAG TPA: phosphoribosylamine--glycine ligase [Candidatus Bathyarchaeia archaeon]|nr:phosphoribosylamine--glycine ligase [Candidatus Bathyarchaeia archaeon]
MIDRGGRGDALCWKLKNDPRVKKVFCAPGNGGMARNGISILKSARTPEEIVAAALREKIDLAVGGAEAPLSAGMADLFRKNKIPIIGPNQEATILESSKGYTDLLCRELGVPVPEFELFEDSVSAKKYIDSRPYEVVVKCDGLAAGKGAVVCASREEAHRAVDLIFERQASGDWGGNSVVVQKRISGRELSFFYITDGHTLRPLPVAKDYKRARDGDIGKNTGGMGSVSPHPWEGEALTRIVTKKIAQPLIDGFREKRNVLYQGFIYFGLIFEGGDIDRPMLLEINIRLGDPEAQVILPRLETSLISIAEALEKNQLKKLPLKWSDEYFCDVVLASGEVKRTGKGKYPGYPGRYKIGFPISGFAENNFRSLLFSAGIEHDDAKGYVTSGGRVLNVVGRGKSLAEARTMAYADIEKINFEGMYFRKEIGLT